MPARAETAPKRTINNPLLWLVALGVFMQMLDSTIVNTALPSMAAGLGESPLRMQSVVIAYALTMAMLIPASGWLADRLGTRRVFFAAITLFTFGSLLCAYSHTLGQLVGSRVVQGVGGAMLLPVGRLAVLRSFPRGEFLRAMSFVTLPGLIGPLIGPTLGGWLVEIASWHWIFLINLPVGIIAGTATLLLMPDAKSEVARFDIVGYLMLSFSMVAISLSLDGLSELGLRHAAVL
ncbi:MAG TPA: MFS transporter, partial [Rhodanobacteraceae bacterium]